ncbi:MAG TPA: OB-fold nucleic acid binding domain-containing protein, partial [Thermomicrobiales bacterium]|nr:OB-fold nucleic acid binding domain-containing protein [Thermomicrobiales bacterium]
PDYIARKHGRTEIVYMHPEMEPILRETYGVALYQEQVIRISNVVAGFSMAEGDGLRKAMGKKLPEEMAKYRDRFIAGCVGHGLEKRLGADVFDMIERFAGYGFNKAHSAAYAVIAAQTAYLKANHPVEFMAALLTSEIGNTDKIVFNAAECRRCGIPLLPPSVNRSDHVFTVERDGERPAIRYGLGAVKNAGAGAVRSIVETRNEQNGGAFRSLDDFCEAVDWSSMNRRVVESLAKCGALDCFGPRSAVLAALDAAIASGQRRQKASARGQIGLFDLGGGASADSAEARPLPDAPPLPPREMLAWEKELLGLYMSDHPLNAVLGAVDAGRGNGFAQIVDLEERPPGQMVRLIAMIVSVRRIATKTNRTMAIVELEDLTGTIELVAFPDCYERHAELWNADAIIEVTGKVDRRGEAVQLICEQATCELSA